MTDEKKWSPIKMIGCGCGAVILIMMLGFGTCGVAIYFGTKAPAAAAQGFFEDLRAQNLPGALARMSPEYQATHPLPTFHAAIASAPALVQNTDLTLSSRNVNSNTASMSGSVTTVGGEVPIAVELLQYPQGWFITSVTVNNQRLP